MYLVAGLAACRQPPADEPPTTVPTTTTGDSSTPTADTADPCGPPTVQPLVSPVAVMVHGVQGGWHIDVGGTVSGIGPTVEVHAAVIRTSDELQLAGDQQPKALDLEPGDECGGQFVGLQALIDDVTPSVPYQEFICSLVGETLRVELDVTDIDTPTRVAIAKVEVVAAHDPYDVCP